MQMYMSKPRLGVVTAAWANRPSAAVAGAQFFATDVGDNGTMFIANGTRWRPMNGAAMLDYLSSATGNITNSETIVLQTLLPIGAWQEGDTARIWLTGTKSGTTDTFNVTVRVGTAGTTGDTAITGLSNFALTAASGVVASGIFDIRLVSSTSAQKLAGNNVNTHPYQNSSGSTAGAAATSITDASANALYLSVSIASSGATNTVALTSGTIQLITP